MRAFQRAGRAPRAPRGDDGAVAVIVALLLAFALIPALALGTGTYVRSSTSTELQRASDSGALAGAAEIPLGDINFAENYIASITGSGVVTTLQSLGIQNAGQLPNPLVDACKVALADGTNANNLATSYATFDHNSQPPDPAVTSVTDPNAWCKAKYLPDAGILGSAQTCLNAIAPTTSLLNNLGLLSLLGLGLGGLSPTKLLGALDGTLPALLEPGIQVTTSWKVTAPFDNVFNSSGSTQTSTSVARRLFKNAVVVPTIPIGGTTINVNPTLQITRTQLLNTLSSVETLLQTLGALVPGLSTCAAVIDNLSGDLADAVDPPSNGPSLTTLLDDAVASGSPVLAVSTAVTGLGVPFLDMVPVCMEKVNGQYVAHLTTFGSCIINAPGAFRAALRNS